MPICSYAEVAFSVFTRICLNIAIVADVFLQRESWEVEIRDDLYRVFRLPQVLKVFSRPTI